MKCLSATSIKRNCAYKNSRSRPTEGSKIGALYDVLQASKGIPVEIVADRSTGPNFICLTNIYGLDIRLLQRGNKRTGRPTKVVLAGEWFGRVYVDYIAAHIGRGAAQ